MSVRIATSLVAELPAPSLAWREAAAAASPDAHARLVADAPCLHAVEAAGRPRREAGRRLRVVAWNAERLKHVEASAAVLAPLDADVLLLTEIDRGMARSGNRHTAGDLAGCLGMAWRYAVEFIELGLGDPAERAAQAGATNRHGLHGAALLSRIPLLNERLIRLGDDGAWFDGSRKGERRVGGRIALAADVSVAGRRLTLCAVHLESHSDARHRATQLGRLLDVIDAPAALVAGDLNTKDCGVGENPDAEPLFAAAAARGFAWAEANAPGATQRLHPGEPARPLAKLDWMLTRGLRPFAPRVVPALAGDRTVLSDHDILVLDLEPA